MIGWWLTGRNLRMASSRIRGELVLRRLRQAGLPVQWFDENRPAGYDTLVVGKRYDPASLATVTRLKQQGARIIVDLCDNHFCFPQDSSDLAEGAERLRQLLCMADHVVASTATLAGVIRQEYSGPASVSVIGDLADDLSIIPAAWHERAAGQLRRSIAEARLNSIGRGGRLGIAWFGDKGRPYAESGMSNLLPIRETLEQINREQPIYLSIISNSKQRFSELIRPWRMPTLYFKWHPWSFETALRSHAIAVIPVSRNAFTECKTDNRVVTAFGAGLAVVTDPIPSYEPYREVIGFGNWDANLRRYLGDAALRMQHAEEGRRIAARLNDPETITRAWVAVLRPNA